MKKIFLSVFLIISAGLLHAQQVDSIFFHLYTDSLKKGQHNYINVDGKLKNGQWLPMTNKEVEFSCTAAVFEGNELIIPADFGPEKVTVKAVLKADPRQTISCTIWIKKKPDPEILPKRENLIKRNR